MEYAQGTGGYTFGYRVHRSGDSTYKTFEDMFQLYDTEATFDADGQSDTAGVWTDRDSFTGGGSRSDIGNIYLHNTNTYEFLIEFAQGGGGGEFNFYAENTDENFTPSPFDINTEFVSLVNLKSKFEVLNELINTKFKYDVYNSPTLDDLTYVKSHYKNEILNWTGTANSSITNLSLLTGDLGNEYVTIIITGYFTPVETNDYVFRFNDNDDAIAFSLVEYGNDIYNDNIAPLSNNTSNTITLESTKTYEFWIRWRQATGYYNFEPQVEVGNSGVFINLYDKNIFTFKSKYELLNERQINGIKYDIYTLNPDGVDWNWGNLEKTIYKNELLSWSGTENDGVTSNLEALTGDLGEIGVGVKISGYFSPVVTNDYIFKFTNNDDTITFDLVEYGENIDNGRILLTNYTSNQIILDSTKIYEFRMSYKQATGPYNFQPQVDIANSGTFVDFYNTSNFDFKVYNDYNALNIEINELGLPKIYLNHKKTFYNNVEYTYTPNTPNPNAYFGSEELSCPTDFNNIRGVADGKWHHIAFVGDLSTNGGSIKIYIDGQKSAEKITDFKSNFKCGISNQIYNDYNSFYIGRDSRYSKNFEGYLSNLKIWDKALTQNEIQSSSDQPIDNDHGHDHDNDRDQTSEDQFLMANTSNNRETTTDSSHNALQNNVTSQDEQLLVNTSSETD